MLCPTVFWAGGLHAQLDMAGIDTFKRQLDVEEAQKRLELELDTTRDRLQVGAEERCLPHRIRSLTLTLTHSVSVHCVHSPLKPWWRLQLQSGSPRDALVHVLACGHGHGSAGNGSDWPFPGSSR